SGLPLTRLARRSGSIDAAKAIIENSGTSRKPTVWVSPLKGTERIRARSADYLMRILSRKRHPCHECDRDDWPCRPGRSEAETRDPDKNETPWRGSRSFVSGAGLGLRPPWNDARSDRLVVWPDRAFRSKHRIDRREHRAEAGFRHRALDHHHHFRLVGGCPDEAPGAVIGDHADAVDGDEIGDPVSRDHPTVARQRREA